MDIEFEIYVNGEWRTAAAAHFHEPDKGYLGAVTLDYDITYFAKHASVDYSSTGVVTDIRALSVRLPVDLASRHSNRWPSFLLDLMPQGHARRQLAKAMGLNEDARASDLPLLLRAGGNTIGNIRVVQAEREERKRLAEAIPVGVTRDEILDRSDRFIEVFDRFMMIASGSSGLQGEWPKVAMTLAADGLFYPDALVTDDQAREHVIVKLVRSDKGHDQDILRLEGAYSSIAKRLGLDVHGESSYAPGVLIIPRFDRAVEEAGNTLRFGQESLVSALGVSEFGYVGSHEDYVAVIKEHSSDPHGDIVEYVCRDIANLAMGNTDNHGRNTALGKYPDGTIRLTPLFDFAPMRLAEETVVRSTRWACMRKTGSDTSPDWQVVCDAVYPEDPAASEALLAGLREFATGLEIVPDLLAEEAKEIGPAVERAIARCRDIRNGLATHTPIARP